MVDAIHGLVGLYHIIVGLHHIIQDDPRIGLALAVLVIAGAFVAVLIRKTPRSEFPTLK